MAVRFELEPSHRNVLDKDYLEDLRAVAAKLGKATLTMQEYGKHGKYHPSSIHRRFNGWPSALQLAGLAVEHFNGGVSAEEALQDLRDVAAWFGKPTLTQAEYGAHGKWSPRPLIRHFGSWLKALNAAGLDPSRTYSIPDEELFDNLEQVWRSLGRQPHYGEVQKPFSRYCAGVYAHRFGSWRKALEAFVASANAETDATPDPVQRALSPDQTPVQSVKRRKTPRTANWRLRFLVLQRDGFRCRSCGASPATQVGVKLQADHIVPWPRGGETVIGNLQTLCETCNIGKSDLMP